MAKYSRVKYNDSRELLIMMIIINVLQVIINQVKVVNMYESYYESIVHETLYHYIPLFLKYFIIFQSIWSFDFVSSSSTIHSSSFVTS